MRNFVNNEIYTSLPDNLKSAIIDTIVVSGHGSTSGETNFTSTDKLYLLSAHEVWVDGSRFPVSGGDTAWNNTRQLDWYEDRNVTTSSDACIVKEREWWLRLARRDTNVSFYGVDDDAYYNCGYYSTWYAHNELGVSPAFRIA